ncbi:PREDICTED: F-box/kelch-repeat protein At3g23880-like [Ipomoea nil]|uniref:F-box/kelch-repeat protein At3g23880-like n=1 Tax=Ipomoea nil TaxID=35883 RepID=UPI00090120A3|nr:PREDICTED: F-box/kelch-repeat protein At3g23880-like [Ipomoea nil]
MYVHIDIIRLILLKLKVEALIRCQCVCKEWRSIIQDPDFKLSYPGPRRVLAAASGGTLTFTSITTSSLHTKTLFHVSENRSSLDTFPPIYRWLSGVWCSCNGLVLFSVGKHILLWNPSTRCCTKVLELPHLSNTFPDDVVSGLCYLSSTGDYKAVLLFRFGGNRTAMVASLKNKEWRKVPFPYDPYSARDGVNFHDTLHWRVNGSRNIAFPWRCKKVIYFQAESDEFKELPTPELHGWKSAILGLGIMDGCLCMVHEGEERGEKKVLVMKEYGVKKSWVCQFVISASAFASELFSFEHSYITLYSSKCNTKVLICNCFCFYGSWEILVYDVKNNKTDNYFSQESEHPHAAAICSYVQSFVSPHEFIWRDDQHKLTENDSVLRFILERFNI